MMSHLLFGLPGERPGGLLLTCLLALGAGAGALVAGLVYAALCVRFPRGGLPLQAAAAVVRGIPLLLLVFLVAQSVSWSLHLAGLVALLTYSFVTVGEILRSFLSSYPQRLIDESRVLGLSPPREWLRLRLPWTLTKSMGALGTHWISLLKDTGALVVLSIGELTTVAKVLSESSPEPHAWLTTLAIAGALYLAATYCLIAALTLLKRRLRIRQSPHSA